jgi:hypothetical protein
VGKNNVRKLHKKEQIMLPKAEAPISLTVDGEYEELASSDPAATIILTEHEKKLCAQVQRQQRVSKLKKISQAIRQNPSDMMLEQL